MFAALLSVLILACIQRGTSPADIPSRQHNYIQKSTTRTNLPSEENYFTNNPLDPKKQSVTDILPPGTDPQSQSVTDKLPPGTDPPNQSVTNIPLPGTEPENQSVTDTLHLRTESSIKSVRNKLHPENDIDLFSDLRSGCELQSWTTEQISKLNTSIKSNQPQMSPKELENLEEFLIKFKQINNSDKKRCYNDTKCVFFGDCCPEKDVYSVDKTYEFYKCTSIKHSLHSTKNYLLVSRCLSFVNDDPETKEKCERDFDPKYPPVTSNEVGRFYKNEFCAKCNGDLNFTKWHVEIVFEGSDWFDQMTRIRNLSDLVDFQKLYEHNQIFKIPNGMSQPWICNKQFRYVDKCNLTSLETSFTLWELVGCLSYTDPVDLYRNIFCKRCNQELFCGSGIPIYPKVPIVSFGALMDLVSLQKYDNYLKAKEKNNSCQPDEFYDFLNERCRHLCCSPGLFLTPNSSCSYIFTSAFYVIYKMHFSLIPQNGSITEEKALRVRDSVFETTQKNGGEVDMMVTLKLKPSEQTNQNSLRLVNRILFYLLFKRVEHTFVGMEKDIEGWLAKIRHAPFTKSFRIVKDLESLEFTENYLSTQTWNKSFYKPHISHNFPSWSLPRALPYSGVRTCPKVTLSFKEFILTEDNLVILIHASRVNLTMDRVEFNSNGTPMICLSDYPGISLNVDPPTSHFVYITLSQVFVGISLLCLAMTLTTYAIFSELRTLPGQCNIFLCCTLSIAQALVLLGTYEDEIVCAVLGSLCHFAWLSTFCWLGICSFHMHRVFTRLLLNDRNSTGILVHYVRFAYGVPSLIVGGTVVFNMAVYGIRITGYGLPNCFLSQGTQLIITFAIPLYLMIVFNATFLFTTIYNLKKTFKECGFVNNDKQSAVVYLKMTSLTGLTWIFGFLSMSSHQPCFRYIFIVTNASQGIYIFLSYTFNRNVLNLYASKFSSLGIRIHRRRNVNVYITGTAFSTLTAANRDLESSRVPRQSKKGETVTHL